jgi:uncharacterized protein with PQ loop repeat
MISPEVEGNTAVIIQIAANLPQLVKTVGKLKADDFSWLYLVMMDIAAAMALHWGVRIGNEVIVLVNGFVVPSLCTFTVVKAFGARWRQKLLPGEDTALWQRSARLSELMARTSAFVGKRRKNAVD